jgi:DNA polymerase I
MEFYDADWSEDAAFRGVGNIVSYVGWDRTDITQYLADTTDTTLRSYCVDL